jgi:phosphatidylserine/phosphatidylglycerophosphate/cardiolipin synthase-like enzyme
MCVSPTSNDVRIVVTPPGEFGAQFVRKLGARTTHGVIIELVTKARSSLLLTAPFIYLGQAIVAGSFLDALRHALDRNVIVQFISTQDSLVALERQFPKLAQHPNVRLFVPRVDPSISTLGSHAKVLLSDSALGYIGSANLTDPGLTGHLEFGVLLGGSPVRQLAAFWNYLLSSGFLQEYERGTQPERA